MTGTGGLRILYLLHRYPQLSQTFVRNEIVALRRAGVVVDVMTVDAGDVDTVLPGWAGPVASFPRTGYGARQGLTALARWSVRHPGRVARMVAHRSADAEYRQLGFRRLPALAGEIAGRNYDRVHTHFAWPSADLARQLADLLDIPASVTVHARDIFDRPIADLAVLEAMDEVVTVCRFNVDYLRDAGLHNPRLYVVPCGVEIPDRMPGTAVPGGTGRFGCDVLAVGRLVPKKGFDTLVEAVAALAGRSPGLSVRIIGDGPERERLQGQIDERGLGEVIRLTGPADHASTLAAIAGAKVFCLPARRAADGDMDALPVVLREAQARSIPVVSTTVAGIPEVVDADSGWLVPPADPPALAAALQQALDDPDARRERGARGRDQVSATGTLAVQARALIEIFGGAVRAAPDTAAPDTAAPDTAPPVAPAQQMPLAGRR